MFVKFLNGKKKKSDKNIYFGIKKYNIFLKTTNKYNNDNTSIIKPPPQYSPKVFFQRR